jgi:hypothetical protein
VTYCQESCSKHVVRHVGKEVVELLLKEVLCTSRIVLTVGRVQQAEDGQSVFEKRHHNHDRSRNIDAFVESCGCFVVFEQVVFDVGPESHEARPSVGHLDK